MSDILQVFLNADLRAGHPGLSALARKYNLDVKALEPGQYLIFINTARNKLKLYAAYNVIAYLKLDRGVIDLNTVRFIPQAFKASGKIDYDRALRQAVETALQKPRTTPSGLQAFKSAKAITAKS